MINSAYQALINVVTQFTRAAGAAQRVLSLMDSLPDISPGEGRVIDWPLRGALALEGVHFHYQLRPDQPVLRGIDLTIPAGSVCAFVGRSGGGKSTCVHLLMRFYDPTKGRITLDGHPLTSLSLRSVHRHFGLVAQDTQLFANSIEENISYGLEKGSYTRHQLHAAARAAFAHDFIMDFPDGYATRVGERGIRLSGGQRQRIAIARVFLRKPRVLLLDEATSALDAESEHLVQEALDKLISGGVAEGESPAQHGVATGDGSSSSSSSSSAGGGGGGGGGRCTVVLVAHRLSTVMNADKIAVVDKGAIVEQGTHDELTASGGVYSKLVARQLARKQNVIDEGNISAAKKKGASKPGAPADSIDAIMEDLDAETAGSGAAAAAVTDADDDDEQKKTN